MSPRRLVRMLAVCLLFLAAATACGVVPSSPTPSAVPSTPTPGGQVLLSLEPMDGADPADGNLHQGSFLVHDESRIYYIAPDTGALVASAPDGSDAACLTRTPADSLWIDGDTLFFSGKGPDFQGIHKIGTDGQGEVRLTLEPVLYLLSMDDQLFYILQRDGLVYTIRKDGSGRLLLFDRPTRSIARTADGTGLWASAIDPADGIHRLDPDGGPTRRVLTTASYSLVPVPEGFLFTDPTRFDSLLRVAAASENGTWDKKAASLYAATIERPFVASGTSIFYIDASDSGRLKSVGPDFDAAARLVVNDAVDRFVIAGRIVYYMRKDEKAIFLVPVEGGLPVRLPPSPECGTPRISPSAEATP